MLSGQGFQQVYNLSGGIQAWEGTVAEGPVELNLDMIRGDETPVEIITLAYGMEQNLGTFYRTVSARTGDSELYDLLSMLASIEDRHKGRLMELHRSVEPSPLSVEDFETRVTATLMEGGFDADEFIKRNDKYLGTVAEVLDLSLMLEAQSLDLYLRFAQETGSDETRRVLHTIGDEEKQHLEALGRLRNDRA